MLVSSSLLAPGSSDPSTAISALFSTLTFNAITGCGLITLLHGKERLMLYIWVHNRSCIKEYITPVINFEQYRHI